MPPKRKALAETSSNASTVRKAKAVKISTKSSPKNTSKLTSKTPTKKSTTAKAMTTKQFKYCNANTVRQSLISLIHFPQSLD